MPLHKKRNYRQSHDASPSRSPFECGWHQDPRFRTDLPIFTAMSRRRKRLVRRAVEHNKNHVFLNLPGEVRNTIFSFVLGEDQQLEPTYPRHFLPTRHGSMTLQGVLGVCKQLRSEGLGFFYGHNKLCIKYNIRGQATFHPTRRQTDPCCDNLPPEADARPQVQSLKKCVIPKIAIQASRQLEMRAEVRVETQLRCGWHIIGLVLVVNGDEYSCRAWWENCDDNELCGAIIHYSVRSVREDFIQRYLKKMRGDDGEMPREMRLIEDERIDSPRYQEALKDGFGKGFKFMAPLW